MVTEPADDIAIVLQDRAEEVNVRLDSRACDRPMQKICAYPSKQCVFRSTDAAGVVNYSDSGFRKDNFKNAVGFSGGMCSYPIGPGKTHQPSRLAISQAPNFTPRLVCAPG